MAYICLLNTFFVSLHQIQKPLENNEYGNFNAKTPNGKHT